MEKTTTTILVVYASDYGSTEKMALAAVEGINSVPGGIAAVKKAEEVTAEDMTASDGVLIGSPVHMGSMDWRVKKMIDTVCSGLWMQDKMNGKVVGAEVLALTKRHAVHVTRAAAALKDQELFAD